MATSSAGLRRARRYRLGHPPWFAWVPTLVDVSEWESGIGAGRRSGRPVAPAAVDVTESDGGGAVAWDTAERVAGWVGSRSRLPAPYRPDLLQRDFEELTAQAEELVAASTGLRSSSGPGPGPGHRPGRLGARQRLQLPASGRPPSRASWTRPAWSPPTG